jgi:hypothetical protein
VFLLVCGFEIFRQGVELVFPEHAVLLDPAGGILHGLGSEAAAVNATVDFAMEKSGRLQNAEVLRHGGEGDVKRLGQFGDGGFAEGQAGENRAAGGIRERAEGGV